jgi:hypothetical protein
MIISFLLNDKMRVTPAAGGETVYKIFKCGIILMFKFIIINI